jgi:hypothetical protein
MNDLPDAHDQAIDAQREVRRLTEENERLKALLRDNQWSSRGPDRDPECDTCGRRPSSGHDPDCPIKAALE